MNFTFCVLMVYNDNGSVQTLCITRVSVLCDSNLVIIQIKSKYFKTV